MKILEINRWLAPGGGERFIVDLSNELAKIENNEVVVCSYIDESYYKGGFYKNELNESVKYVNLGGHLGALNQIKNVFKVFKFIKKLKPDVVHCHLSAFWMCVLPCLFFRNIVFVNTLHNVADRNIKPGVEKRVKTFMYKFGMRAVTISPLCYKSFSNYMGFNNSVMIDNGCRDIGKSEQFGSVVDEIQGYKKTSQTKVFINVARLHPQKNHPLLVKTFESFVKKGYDAVLLIIGAYDEHPEITNEVKSLIQSDRVFLLGNKHNVPDYLYCSDVFCLSSKWEGAPISLLEAAFAGCFPICTPAGGCVDDIASDEWGYLSKDFSEAELLKGFEKYMTEKNPSREYISNLYKEKFSMKTCAQKYMDIFLKKYV